MGSTTRLKPPKLCMDCGHCNIGISNSVCIFCNSEDSHQLAIPYHEQYLFCKHCNMRFCDDCHSLHPDNHLRENAIALKSLTTSSNIPPKKKRCFDCLDYLHCVTSCDECSKNWCPDCIEAKVESFNKHEHREMTCLEPPGFEILADREATCGSCSMSSSFLHCESCRQGKGEGIMMICKTCWVDYGSTPALCKECFNTFSKHHDRSHLFISYRFEVHANLPEDYLSIHCRECEQSFISLNRKIIKDHPHRQYTIAVGHKLSEDLAYRQWRLCSRRGVLPDEADDSAQIKTIRKCQRCLQSLAFRKQNAFCSTCYFHFCEHCVISGNLNHPHGALTICTWVERRAPEDFLKTGKLWCSLCSEELYKDYNRYMWCQECFNYIICDACYKTAKVFQHAHGSERAATFLHVQPPADQLEGTTWWNEILLRSG